MVLEPLMPVAVAVAVVVAPAGVVNGVVDSGTPVSPVGGDGVVEEASDVTVGEAGFEELSLVTLGPAPGIPGVVSTITDDQEYEIGLINNKENFSCVNYGEERSYVHGSIEWFGPQRGVGAFTISG